jgi:hypothetical protein
MIVDVSNPDRVVDVEIPYKSVYPLLRCCNSVFNPDAKAITYGNSMGIISVSAYTPLVFSNGTAGSVNICAMYAWGDDFELLYDRSCPISYSESMLKIDPSPPLTTVLNNFAKMNSVRDLLMKPVRYTVVTMKKGNPTSPAMSNVVPLNPALLSYNAEWSYAFSTFAGYKGSIRWIVRIVNNSGEGNFVVAPIRATVHTNVQNKYTTLAYGADASSFWDDAGTNAPNVTDADGSSLIGMRFDRTAWSSTNSSAVVGPYAARPEVLLSNTTQPEAVFEIPCGCPQYRYIPARIYPPNSGFTTVEKALDGQGYSPLVDEASAILTLVNTLNLTDVRLAASVEVYAQAGDDFELLHFNGGPTVGKTAGIRCIQGSSVTTFDDPRVINNPVPYVF